MFLLVDGPARLHAEATSAKAMNEHNSRPSYCIRRSDQTMVCCIYVTTHMPDPKQHAGASSASTQVTLPPLKRI